MLSSCHPHAGPHANKHSSVLDWGTIWLQSACPVSSILGIGKVFLCDVQFPVVYPEAEVPVLLPVENDGRWPGADSSITPRRCVSSSTSPTSAYFVTESLLGSWRIGRTFFVSIQWYTVGPSVVIAFIAKMSPYSVRTSSNSRD
jgi:hypothetical protein